MISWAVFEPVTREIDGDRVYSLSVDLVQFSTAVIFYFCSFHYQREFESDSWFLYCHFYVQHLLSNSYHIIVKSILLVFYILFSLFVFIFTVRFQHYFPFVFLSIKSRFLPFQRLQFRYHKKYIYKIFLKLISPYMTSSLITFSQLKPSLYNC